ncbi:hypothetical protein RBE51_13225 [Pseudomonas taiwanensis]|uniref:hypothetical protein n=1 Tax=Pseudomonas taiwanensis TaxID=470150 RepID=UPI0028DF6006|nr:hypothetical protein [Pseudomonas taiwanensis]MDT8923775.1 hypothetical protein [Pseudomonas taiwanensis]
MRVTISALKRAMIQDNTVLLPEDKAAFLVRVQLTNCENYDDFHYLMEKSGFSRSIEDLGGKPRKLPDATYFFSDQPEKTRAKEVHAKVSQVVRAYRIETEQIEVESQIIVVAAREAWFDLEEAPVEQD